MRRNNRWYTAEVLHGDGEGRKIGYPTVNLDPKGIPIPVENGVYACKIKVENVMYDGALFYGQRLVKNEKNVVLEIHIIRFDGDLYGKNITFQIGPYVREIKMFATMDALRKQIAKDIAIIAPF